MKAFFPAFIGITFPLLVAQAYLLLYFSLVILRRMKLLKRPYSGMEYSESLRAGVIILGVLLISSVDAPGIFQAARSYSDRYMTEQNSLFLLFVRSFLVIFSFSLLFIVLNSLNARFLFGKDHNGANLSVSILFCAISIGFAVVFWFTCKEVVDSMTPKYINFQ